MTPELTALTLAALLQVLQFAAFAIPANRDLGMGYTSSARDRAPSKQMSEKTARLQRAFENHFEGLLLFAIATLVITFSDQGSAVTAACAILYLVARVAYVPAYYFGWRPWRSLIWFVGFGATTIMLCSALI